VTAGEAWIPNRPVSATLHAGKASSVTGLAPARYSVRAKDAQGSCYASAQAILDLVHGSAAQPVEVTLTPPGSIRGHLTGTAQPLEYVVVSMALDGLSQRIALPNEKGQFAFSDLAPGLYSVLAAGPNSRWMPAPGHAAPPMEISGGAPTTLELHVAEVSR
jgi:hypothetical protein